MPNKMWMYINQIKEKLEDLLASEQIQILSHRCDFRDLKRLIFVASGSSYNIAMSTKFLFEKLALTEVLLYTPFDFVSNTPLLSSYSVHDTLVVAISQTGTSSGTVNAMDYAQKSGFRVLALTEREETPLRERADFYLNFLCGLEESNAKTKGYCNSLVLLQLCALHIASAKKTITQDIFDEYYHEIQKSISFIPKTIATASRWVDKNRHWASVDSFLVVGPNTVYGATVEGMLKLLETMCVLGSVCELGEFSHGFHRTIHKKSNVITILTEGYGKEVMIKTNTFLKEKAGNFICINGSKETINDPNYINIDDSPLTSSSLNISVAFQVLSALLPEGIGKDPNFPMNEDFTRFVSTRVCVK